MNSLSNLELADFARNQAVKQLKIVQNNKSGKYRIIVKLTWKEGDWSLSTSRKTIREWASLDRLVRHIRENYGIPPSISLSLSEIRNDLP
ncbi:MAG: hypothetical protein LBP86_03680 [Azoarcus sp.]|jgi:hypothetical protein|nr:hypothetical protein [Azoarcus sp.]